MEFCSVLEECQRIINSDAHLEIKIDASLKMQHVIAKILDSTYYGTTLNGNEQELIEKILSSGNSVIEDTIKDSTISGDYKRYAGIYKDLELRNTELALCLDFNVTKKNRSF